MSLLQMSFSGAVLILAITVVRAVAINKLSKKTFLFLWGIVLVRLLIPFSIPSTVSVYSLVDQNTYADTFEGTPMGNILPIVPETQTEPMEPIGGVQQVQLQHQPVEHMPSASASASVSAWFVVWCIGMVLCMVFFTTIYLHWLSKFRTSRSVHNRYIDQWLEAHRSRRPISIRQSDRIDAPLTYGIFRPVILMPKGTDWTDTKKLQYILLHEYVHICRYDTVIKLIATLALCIHWFNPLVWVMYLLLNRDLELSCDESVVRRFGVASRSTYAHVLISMEAEKSGLTPFYNSFSKNAIEERITSIMKIKKASLFAILTAVVLIISFTAVFVTSAAKQPESQQADAGSDELAINTQLLQYLNMTYAQFKEQVGTEAEFYHGLYFQAPIAGNDANVVFQGTYDEEVAGTVISDDDKSFRVESRLNDIISGISKEMTVTEFMEILDLHAGFTHEMYPDIQEGLTAYYVAYHYVEMNIDSNGDSVLDIQLSIALDESDHITPDALTWIYESTFFEASGQNDDAETADVSGLSPQDPELINGGIRDNRHNIYTGYLGNEEIRMLITRTGDSLYAEYTTRSGEGRVFQGNLTSGAAGFVLNTDDGEYLKGVVTKTDDGYFIINGEGVLSQNSVTFTLYQEVIIMMGNDLENYYAFFEHNADEAEQFAQQIKDSINDKTAFAGLIQYPISIKMNGSQIMVENEENMIDIYDRLMEQNGFRQQIENIFTKYMFAHYGGICIEDGIIWFSETASGDYKITAINPPVTPVSEIDTTTLFAQMPDTFYFSSGAGGWVTYLYLSDDGTFTGLHIDGDMGDADPSLFPNGTEYRCEFAGAFTEPVKVGDYVCSTHVVSLEYAPPETVTYADGKRYITSTPYGLDNVDEVLIYPPGYPVKELSEDVLSWIQNAEEFWGPDPKTLPFYVLYNVNGQEAFYSEAQ